MSSSHRKTRTLLGLATALAFAVPGAAHASAAAAEPNPCAGRGDGGTGGDYYDGISVDHNWSHRRIYGTWYNCSGGTGADRVRIVVSTDNDGPCITVPYGRDAFSSFIRKYKVWAPHYDGWKRC
ncbi:hypothetical protein HS041_07750 [Planomonospora sp. ID67723]|uniref:hypothetical protein n=1 Tax=Planomonospora sp. ID67723 TaxID=2738134 RepID=UPI0018C3883B|nr:hypothetical protein [Planomonospora sp. ID67723]MBG0827654.1 hypothetical protein [Planomonospora sp. ID67723]